MYVTVRDVMNMEALKSFKLLAGAGGLGNRVNKVAILDFEFTKHGAPQTLKEYWTPGDFVISSLQFAKDNEALLLSALKKLRSLGTSGLTVKNVFSLEMDSEIIRFANAHNYPLILMTDTSLFFEDIIVRVNDLIRDVTDYNLAERRINHIVKGNGDAKTVKTTLLEINYTFMNAHFCVYFSIRDRKGLHRLPALLSAEARRVKEISGSSLVKYQDGFFYIFTTNQPRQANRLDVVEKLCGRIGLRKEDFCIGISEMRYHLNHARDTLLQALYAAAYSRVENVNAASFENLGIYRFLLPFAQNRWAEDFHDRIVGPILENDLTARAKLLDFAMAYEAHRGDRQALATLLHTHENTIRYRINKVRKLLDFHEKDPTFDEQLFLAIKLHRIKTAMGDELPDIE